MHRGPLPGPGRARATRWPRSSPTGCSAATATFPGADLSTKLKLLGVDVASFGDAFAHDPGRARGRLRRPGRGRLQEARPLRRRADAARRHPRRRRVGVRARCGRCSAASSAATRPPGCCPRAPAASGRTPSCPTTPTVCSCNNVTRGHDPRRRDRRGLHRRRRRQGAAPAPAPRCGSCLPLVKKLVGTELAQAGVAVSNALCEHFALSPGRAVRRRAGHRAAHLQRDHRAASAPAAAATSASRSSPRSSPRLGDGHVLDGEQARAAGHQRPRHGQHPEGRHLLGRAARCPGGEITPEQAHR